MKTSPHRILPLSMVALLAALVWGTREVLALWRSRRLLRVHPNI